jgi:hypothetical protein
MGSVSLSLSEAELQAIESTLSQIHIQGDRYPESLKARVGR